MAENLQQKTQANNKLIYSFNGGDRHPEAKLLHAYAESLIFDGIKRNFWIYGKQFGNAYYGSHFAENFNDFLNNTAHGTYAHAEGHHTVVTSNSYSGHAEGSDTVAHGTYAHAEGKYSYASGSAAHSEGYYTTANGENSSSQGYYTYADGLNSHAEGNSTSAYGENSHVEGVNNITTTNAYAAHAEGSDTVAHGTYSHTEGLTTYTTGSAAHAEGNSTYANGDYSHAEGNSTYANGENSHAEGCNTEATNHDSHAEGHYTYSSGYASHTEGTYTYATNLASHAEGAYTYATDTYTHAEGLYTYSQASASHTEGYRTYTYGIYSHAEGNSTYANGEGTHAEGNSTYANGNYSHAEGLISKAIGEHSHAEGCCSVANGNGSHAEGCHTYADAEHTHTEGWFTHSYGIGSHAEGNSTYSNGSYSHAEGCYTYSNGTYSHAEGYDNTAQGDYSHAEGYSTYSIGICSHTEGTYTYSNGDYSHAEGYSTYANGENSHAEGYYNTAEGECSHAEGEHTYSIGKSSHTEGTYTYSLGEGAHAEGNSTYANGNYSHTEGCDSSTYGTYSHTEGRNNLTYGNYSHTEGYTNTTYGEHAHTEGCENVISENGNGGHAEGCNTYVDAAHSHTEGYYTTTYGTYSHAEGNYTVTKGDYTHAEGNYTYANGTYSHAEGDHTVADGLNSHSTGSFTYSIGNNSSSFGSYSYAVASDTIASGTYSYAMGLNSAVFNHYTQAYNQGESSFGSYNRSYHSSYENEITNPDNHEDTIFSIGDGTSYQNRHNVVEVNASYTYIANQTYLGSYLIGDISYSYIGWLGPWSDNRFWLGYLFKALINEPKYTKPVFYTKFCGQENIVEFKHLYDEVLGTYRYGGYEEKSIERDYTMFYPSYLTSSETNITLKMEVGTLFKPGVFVQWPTTQENPEIGTRSAFNPECRENGATTHTGTYNCWYEEVPQKELGYSGGPNGNLTFKYNNYGTTALNSMCGDKIPGSNTLYADQEITLNSDANVPYKNERIFVNTYALINSTYTNPELSPFKIIGDIKLPYKQSTYMLYEQLRKVNYNQISYEGDAEYPWFPDNVETMPYNFNVEGRFKWYCGFTDILPHALRQPDGYYKIKGASDTSMTNEDIYEIKYNIINNRGNHHGEGFIHPNPNETMTLVEYHTNHDDAQKRYFWIAIPSRCGLWNCCKHRMIEVERHDGVCFDLVTEMQQLNVMTLTKNFPLGGNRQMGRGYDIYWVRFDQAPLGSVHDIIRFVVAPIPESDEGYILFEDEKTISAYNEEYLREFNNEHPSDDCCCDEDMIIAREYGE